MKTNGKNNLRGAGLVIGAIAMSALSANAFEVNTLGTAGEVRANLINVESPFNAFDAKCGEKSKETKTSEKSTEAKCGEKSSEAKCGEKSTEAKCGEKSTEAKCGEK